MKHNPSVNAQTYSGTSALYFSSLNGNVEITKLLLLNNADCNVCVHSKKLLVDTYTNHPQKTLKQVKQFLCDCLIKNASSYVTDYVSKKSVDYVFGIVTGSSPLHIACFMGKTDVVRCLLNNNANTNMKKKMAQHRYFMHVKSDMIIWYVFC
ncbi:ANKRD28 [Mytilus edulis]|uniref:ANKRD28 n=1 Tax=Mytilus edulis TaxID=6550 RepID=A0A8S3QR03_MYTED|nr:ANKRD28 [Mytilus edulis]